MSPRHRPHTVAGILVVLLAALVAAQPAAPPATQSAAEPAAQASGLTSTGDAVRFAAIGDNGTGDREQYQVADQMARVRERFPFEFVIMLGDNLYGRERPQDYTRKFERPYKALLDAGVKFYASLGNHDDTNQRFYEGFNMDGKRYYSFRDGPVQFFALDSNYMDPEQLTWIEEELEGSRADWKIAFFHHPPYSSGRRHGSEVDLRNQLEPLFVEHGVQVVFNGHEHFYERIRPQHGIHYFISGAGGKLRRGDIRRTPLTAKGFDTDRSFIVVQIAGDTLTFESISRLGVVIDSGTIARTPDAGTSSGAASRTDARTAIPAR